MVPDAHLNTRRMAYATAVWTTALQRAKSSVAWRKRREPRWRSRGEAMGSQADMLRATWRTLTWKRMAVNARPTAREGGREGGVGESGRLHSGHGSERSCRRTDPEQWSDVAW